MYVDELQYLEKQGGIESKVVYNLLSIENHALTYTNIIICLWTERLNQRPK